MAKRPLDARLHELFTGEGSKLPIPGVIRPFRPGAHKQTFLRQIKLPGGARQLSIIKVPRDEVAPKGPNRAMINLREHSLDFNRHSEELKVIGKIGTVFTLPSRHQTFFDKELGRVEEWEFAGIDLDLASSTKERFNSRIFQNAIRETVDKTIVLYMKQRIALDAKLANYTLLPTESINITGVSGPGRRVDEGIPVGTGKKGVSYVDPDPEDLSLPDPNDPYALKPVPIAWRMARLLDQIGRKDIAFNGNLNATAQLQNHVNKQLEQAFGYKTASEMISHMGKFMGHMKDKEKDLDITILK